MSTAKRVIKNTGILYAKMGITMFISLYTTRLVLNALGTTDFGIFNIVGGAIAMLMFLNGAMSSATQRFMSFAEGEGNANKAKTIFNTSIILHIIISFILLVFFIIAYFIFFHGLLKIPESRIETSKIVYAFFVLSTIFTVITVPYEAVMNAHENMLYYSIVGIIESLLKLSIALFITAYSGDKLVLYGGLMATIPLLTGILMRVYCHKKYDECEVNFKKHFEKGTMIEMGKFASYNLLGISSGMVTQYGSGIVLNSFFGTIVNAAQGLANQLSGMLMVFSNIFIKAFNPTIDKAAGSGDYDKIKRVAFTGSKVSFFAYSFIAIPVIFETPFLLKLWLNKVPDFAIIFVRLQIIRTLVDQFTIIILKSVESTGKIKELNIAKSITNILPICLSIIAFFYGAPPYFYYILWIIFYSVLGAAITMYYSIKFCKFTLQDFFSHLINYVVIITFALTITSYTFIYFLEPSFSRLIINFATSTIVFLLVSYYFCLTADEKKVLSGLTNKNRVFL